MDKLSLEISEDPIACPLGPSAGGRARQSPWLNVTAVLLLAVATLLAHGQCLLEGPFLDDHLHVLRYQSTDWSVRHLLNATTIEPQKFMDSWWQDQPVRWQYARPFSVLLAQAVYHLSGGSVKALHGLSLGLHFVAVVMVFCLCRMLTRRPGWSLVGGLLFVVHSHSVYAVGWLAAQNCLLQTVLTLAALFCYIRASRLNVYAGADEVIAGKDSCESGLAGARIPSRTHFCGNPLPRAVSLSWFGLTLLFWLPAVFSRENALVFPAFAAAFDLAFADFQQVRRRVPAYALMGLIAAAFAIWRLKFFYYPMPAFYVRTYDGPGYILWWLAKLLHYITGVVWLSPLMLGPSTRINPFQEVPGDCALMIAIITIMASGYYLACRRARGWWIWPLWILLSLLPVVPVFAAPHSAYMPAVAFAVAMIIGPALRREIQPLWIGRWSPVVATWFLIATITYMPIYHTFWKAVQVSERLTIAQMAADPPGPATTDMFLINLPFVNIYARLHLAEELARHGGGPVSEPDESRRDPSSMLGACDGNPSLALGALIGQPAHALASGAGPSRPGDFRCHVLTYSSNVLRMEEPCRLEQIDACTFRLSTQGRGYFSGALGRFLIEAMHPSGKFHAGQVIHRELFDVEIARANAEGVQELQFRFRKPLSSPEYCFYLTTNHEAAARVHFWGPQPLAASPSPSPGGGMGMAKVLAAAKRLNAGQSRAASTLFAAMGSNQPEIRAAAMTEFRQVAIVVARALAAPIEDILAQPDWSESDRARIEKWWGDSLDDRNLRVLWVRRGEWRLLQRARDCLFRIQRDAGRIIRTDLYMTGPPYPGPR